MELRDVGDADTLVGTFRNQLKQLANPSLVTLVITKPDGTTIEESGTVALPGDFRNPSTGRWEYDHSWDAPGDWTWAYRGQGSVTTRGKGSVRVRP